MLQKLITTLFTSMTGFICLYSFIALVIITVDRMRLSAGMFRDFIDKLLVLSGISFLFTLWLLVLKLNGVSDASSVFFTNILLMTLITSVAYTAFSLNQLTKVFGFRRIQDEFKSEMNKAPVMPVPKKQPKKKR